MKTKLIIVPPSEHKTGGNGQLYKFTGISCPAEHVATIPSGYIGIEARKKASELFGDNGFEFVNQYTGNPVD